MSPVSQSSPLRLVMSTAHLTACLTVYLTVIVALTKHKKQPPLTAAISY